MRDLYEADGTGHFSRCRIFIQNSQSHGLQMYIVKFGAIMKHLLAISIVGVTTISAAETLILPSFRIEIADGWVHRIEREAQARSEFGERISTFHPGGNGILQIQLLRATDSVSQERLRNLTNVDLQTALDWQEWGDFAGYQYDYSEGGSFFRQWWLANERRILLVTYDSNAEITDNEIDQINKIVNSIKLNTVAKN